jgi:hypothetical protein
MPLRRIHARPSCTVLTRPACATVLATHCCVARMLGSGDFTDSGGPAKHSEWRRLRRSTDDAVSSPGQRGSGAAIRRPVTRRSAARLDGDLHRNGEGEAAGNRSTWRWEGGDHGGQSGENGSVARSPGRRR